MTLLPRREKRQDGCSLGWDWKQSRNALFESSSLWWETPGDFAPYGELRSRGSWRIKKKKEEEEKEKEKEEEKEDEEEEEGGFLNAQQSKINSKSNA